MAEIKIIPAKDRSDEVVRTAAYARVSSSSEDQLNSFAAQIRYYTELLNTYRKPAPQNAPQQPEATIMDYEPTEEIQRMTNEINRLLDSENSDKEKVEALIIKCAQLKYTTICEVKT